MKKVPQLKNIHKRTLVLISIVIVALVIAAVAVVLSMTMFAKPDQADFKQTQASVNQIQNNYEKYGTAYGVLVSDIADGKGINKDGVNKAFDTYDKQLKSIGDQRALKNDSVKKAYDSYVAKSDSIQVYYTSYLDDLKLYYAVADSKCPSLEFDKSNPATTVKNYDALLKTCQKDFDALKKSKNEVFKLYATEVDKYLQNRRPLYEKVSTLAQNPLAPQAEYQAALKALGDSKFPDLESKIQKIQEGLSLGAQYDALKAAVKKADDESK